MTDLSDGHTNMLRATVKKQPPTQSVLTVDLLKRDGTSSNDNGLVSDLTCADLATGATHWGDLAKVGSENVNCGTNLRNGKWYKDLGQVKGAKVSGFSTFFP